MTRRTILVSSAPLLLVLGLVACEDSSSSAPPTTPDASPGFDAGGGGDGGDEPIASQCPEPTAAPVAHQANIVADETWGAGLHDVNFDIAIRQNATLTIEPCAVLRVVAHRGIQVGTGNAGDGGKLVAKGKAALPIVIQGQGAGRWASLQVNPLGLADLAYVTIKDAGDRASARGGAALHLVGDGTKPIQPLATVDHVVLEGAEKYGAVLEARAAFAAGSQALTVTGAGDMPLRVSAPSLGTIPTGKYTGNTVDAIRVFDDLIDADVTMHDRGVPYVAGGDGQFSEISVQGKDGTVPVLTIEPGVTVKFSKSDRNSGLFVERMSTDQPARGALRAIGTADRPIVFTSNEATPAAGDWLGVHFRSVLSPLDKLDYVRVEYAGGDTGTRGFSCGTAPSPDPVSNEAAIGIFGPPAGPFVTHTVVTKSAANGIERGWTGAPVDFLATNTFTDVAYCRQTFPRPTGGACPDPAPCD
jgi:hypothetical protein